MEHLSIEEIIRFVSIHELDDESMELLSRVNGHIIRCPECLEKVRAYKTLHEKFIGIYEENQLKAVEEEFLKEKELEPQELEVEVELEVESEEMEMEM